MGVTKYGTWARLIVLHRLHCTACQCTMLARVRVLSALSRDTRHHHNAKPVTSKYLRPYSCVLQNLESAINMSRCINSLCEMSTSQSDIWFAQESNKGSLIKQLNSSDLYIFTLHICFISMFKMILMTSKLTWRNWRWLWRVHCCVS